MSLKKVKGEIDLRGLDMLAGSKEFLRMWSKQDGPAICLIDPAKLGADPFLFGMALVDAARHGAKAWAAAVGVTEAEAMKRIWEGFDAERGTPTDLPRQLRSH